MTRPNYDLTRSILETNAVLKEQLDMQDAIIAVQLAKIEELQKQLNILGVTLDALVAQLGHKETEIHELKTLVSSLKNQLDNSHQKIKSLSESLADFTQQNGVSSEEKDQVTLLQGISEGLRNADNDHADKMITASATLLFSAENLISKLQTKVLSLTQQLSLKTAESSVRKEEKQSPPQSDQSTENKGFFKR